MNYDQLSRFTETLLPYPVITGNTPEERIRQASENNKGEVLKAFWQTEEGQKYHQQVIECVRSEIYTAELQQWWDEFNRKYPPEKYGCSQ